ncbi:MAG: hypothetical protein HON90_02120 [Halobacteriovoraceae bacterium]|jgi:hypothetical protein|nr:hypothetical protein [Halobacteriovoraceae bacterium]
MKNLNIKTLSFSLRVVIAVLIIFSSYIEASEKSSVDKVNIVLIADVFTNKNALRNNDLSKIMNKRPGEWKIIRVTTTNDIVKAIHLSPNKELQTLLVYGLHTTYNSKEKLSASTRNYSDKHKSFVYNRVDLHNAFNLINRKTSPNLVIAFNSCNLVPDDDSVSLDTVTCVKGQSVHPQNDNKQYRQSKVRNFFNK